MKKRYCFQMIKPYLHFLSWKVSSRVQVTQGLPESSGIILSDGSLPFLLHPVEWTTVQVVLPFRIFLNYWVYCMSSWFPTILNLPSCCNMRYQHLYLHHDTWEDFSLILIPLHAFFLRAFRKCCACLGEVMDSLHSLSILLLDHCGGISGLYFSEQLKSFS